jgi:uncharacterized membrane protein (DUF4010 family)
MMGLQAVGYVASRLAGPRYGLPLAGLASGFVSSTATVASMGARCRSQEQWLSDCRLAAWSSCLATNVQLVLVMLTIQAMHNGLVGGDFAQLLKQFSGSTCFTVDEQVYV